MGITASTPYVMEKGVSPVDLLKIVLYDHSTWGNSSTHFSFASSSLFFSISRITLFVALACPFPCGYAGVD